MLEKNLEEDGCNENPYNFRTEHGANIRINPKKNEDSY